MPSEKREEIYSLDYIPWGQTEPNLIPPSTDRGERLCYIPMGFQSSFSSPHTFTRQGNVCC